MSEDGIEHSIPDGWVREDRLDGMNLVHEDGHFGGVYKCDRCDHFIPIETVDEAVCPSCGTGGLIGTVIMGTQEVTFLYPADFFDDESDGGRSVDTDT